MLARTPDDLRRATCVAPSSPGSRPLAGLQRDRQTLLIVDVGPRRRVVLEPSAAVSADEGVSPSVVKPTL